MLCEYCTHVKISYNTVNTLISLAISVFIKSLVKGLTIKECMHNNGYAFKFANRLTLQSLVIKLLNSSGKVF